MRIEAFLFGIVSVFLFVAAAIYGWWSSEPVGTTALVLSGAFCGMIGSYFAFIARRIDLRPEDRGDADVAEGAGELGFFSPYSYWPFGMGLSVFVMALGTAFWQAWLMVIGGAAIILTVGGLLFEYYVGQNQV